MSGNIVKEIPKEEEKKFFKTNYKSSSFCYGIFEEKQPISVISVGKPKDNNLKYQYEILNYSGNQQQFEQLWKHFLNGHSCHSCICRKDLPFLENFGFKKNNNFYSYYPFSVVYRADDLTDGKFYIGMSEVENSWKNGYLGSGRYWNNHKNAYPNHKYRRTILKKNFDTPLDTRDFELQEIEKVFNDENNCNSQKRTQGQSYFSTKECKECSGKSGHHKKGCSKYKELLACPECGGKKGNHKKGCSQYKEKTVPVPCSECGGKFGHKKTCSQYKEPKPCQECGRTRSHKKSCSQYKEPKKCSECGLTHGNHKKSCPFYKEPKICPECNGIDGAHFKTCLHYTPPEACSECGALYGKHKDSCSHSKGKCQYCGYSLRSNKHSKDCPLYKEPSICSECGGKGGNHKRNCSKAIKCPECGVSGGGHILALVLNIKEKFALIVDQLIDIRKLVLFIKN